MGLAKAQSSIGVWGLFPYALLNTNVLVVVLFLYSGFIKSRGWFGAIDLTLVAALLLIVSCILTVVFHPRIQTSQLRHFIGFIIFLSFMTISYLSGEQSTDATSKLLQLTVYGSLSLLSSMILFQNEDKFLQFFFIIFALSVIGGVHEILVSPLAGLIQTELTESGYQWSSRMAFYSTLIGLFYVRYQKGSVVKMLVVVGILVGALGVVFGGGRQGILALAACLCYSFYVANLKLSRSAVRLVVSALISILLVYLFTLFILGSFLSNVDPALFSSKLLTFYNKLFFSEDMIASVLGGRSAIYGESWQMFSNNPFFGIGFGEYAFHSTLENYRHAHNLILELLSETGLFGLAMFLLFWRVVLYSLFNRELMINSSVVTRLCAYLIVGQLAMMQVSGDLGNNSLVFFFGGLFVTSLHLDKERAVSNSAL